MHVRREAQDVNVVDVLPRDAIESIDEPTFGETYFGDPETRWSSSMLTRRARTPSVC